MWNNVKKIKVSDTVKALIKLLLLLGLAVLTLTAVTFKQKLQVKSLEIITDNTSEDHLVDVNYLKSILEREFESDLVDVPIDFIDISSIEKLYNENAFIKSSEVFVDKSGGLTIEVVERKPIVRVMSDDGGFYLDDEGVSVPRSNQYSARLPVLFCPRETEEFLNEERRNEIVQVIKSIQSNDFSRVMVDQIEMTQNNEFLITPFLGDEKIKLGNVENINDKLYRLETFYKNKVGDGKWHICAVVDLRFKGQVVCKKDKP